MNVTIYPASQFKKSFKKLSRDIQQSAIAKDKIFRENPHAPSLKTHKLKGKLSSTEVALSIASGDGKEHMALISALLSIPAGVRFVALTKDGIVYL